MCAPPDPVLTASGAAAQIFEGTAPSGHIKVSDLLNALTTYGSTKLTEEQAAELVGQVRPQPCGGDCCCCRESCNA